MAEDRVLLLLPPQELECVVCTCRYVEPCTLHCGHSFCRGCIERHWQSRTRWNCPICQRNFSSRPELGKNTILAAVLEALQEQESRCDNNCSACTGPESRHLCLSCMAPLCQEHLPLHRDKSAVQRHLVVTLQTPTCLEHRRTLSTFCVAHSALVCPTCTQQSHTACRTEPLSKRYRANRERLERTIRQLDQEIALAEEAITRQENAAHQLQILISDMKDILIRDFWDMRNYLEQQEWACFRRIQLEQEKAQEVNTQDLQVLMADADRLKKLKLELQDRVDNDWMAVLKEAESVDNPHSASSQKTQYTIDANCLSDVTETISSLKRRLLSHPLLEPIPHQPEDTLASQVSPPAPCVQVSDVNISEREKNLQWATTLRFDPETVNARLRLSEDLRTVTVTSKNCLYRKHERRFISSQVMCLEGFSSDCRYWEISTAECDSWAIGVAAAEMGRDDKLGRNALSWCVEWSKGGLYSWHNNQELCLLQQPQPRTVGVLLNCPEHSLTFYSVSSEGQTIIYSCQVQIPTRVFPAVWLYGLKPGNSLTIRDLQSPTE